MYSKKFLNSKDSKSVLIFLLLQWWLIYYQFCDFSLNKSCKTYPETKLPPGGRNWQHIYPNWQFFEAGLIFKQRSQPL